MLARPPRKNRNTKGLALGAPSVAVGSPSLDDLAHVPASAGRTPSAVSSSSSYRDQLSEQLANLELGVEFHLDLKSEDLEMLHELGSGAGGTVTKVLHVPTRAVMAKKVNSSIRTHSSHVAHHSLVSTSPMLGDPHCNIREYTQTDPARIADHARLLIALHRLILRSLHLGAPYLHVHGVYGQGVSSFQPARCSICSPERCSHPQVPRQYLQEGWPHPGADPGQDCLCGRYGVDVSVRGAQDYAPRYAHIL
jgi:hypothetical protein